MRSVWMSLAMVGCQFPLVTGQTTKTGTPETPCTCTMEPGHATTGVTTSDPGAVVSVEERFVQEATARADVLLVVDDSGLVADLDVVTDQLPQLLDWLLGSGIDYHVGVVTTDLDDPATAGVLVEADGVQWVDANTLDPLGVLGAMLDVPQTGSATVQPFGATAAALDTNAATSNAGFVRDDSTVTVIALGDGSDASTVVLQGEFEDWFLDFRPDPDQRSFSCLLAPGVALGTTCGAVAGFLGGIEATGDDPAAYDALGLLATGLTRQFFLASHADPARIEVSVEAAGGVVLVFAEGADWTYDPVANAVSFVSFVPVAGDTVVVRYGTLP